MNSSKPKLSVIVVVLNGAKTLQRCIDSVAEQSYPNKELIIIDGGSSDATVEIIRFNKQHVDSWVSEPDRGIYPAMNKGVERAAGDWIIFLGADDFLMAPDVLAAAAERLATIEPQTRLAYGKVAVVSEAGKVIGSWGDFNHQLDGLPHQGTFHHRSLFQIHGGFDESFRIAGDYELLLRELRSGNAAEFFRDMTVAAFSWGGVSTALTSATAYWIEYARARRLNGLFPYPLGWWKCFLQALSLHVRRRLRSRNGSQEPDEIYCEMRVQSPSGISASTPASPISILPADRR
jgi:glycosyltransferase involved in cell wall biosynthesis